METKPLVIVQNNHVERLTAPMAEAARRLGVDLHDVSSGDQAAIRPLPETAGAWSPILVIGSVLFVHQWARDNPILTPWVFWDDAQYDAALWAERIGGRYLNANGYETTIGSLLKEMPSARHIRPRSGIKMIGDKVRNEDQEGRTSIPGLVVTPETLPAYNIDPDTAVWASAPKDIVGEVRVWMIGGRAAGASTYRISGEHHRTTDHPFVREALTAAHDLHRVWHPDRHYVVDFAMTGEGMKVVEYNPLHSSGWYAVDPATILDAYIRSEVKSASIAF